MTRVINKKKGGGAELPLSTQEPAQEPTQTESTTTEVEFDEQAGTATFTLECGKEVTLKEPKAKDFIYLASRMETAPAWQRSGSMSVYLLSHLMINKVSGLEKLPDFDEFMDMLDDEDLARVGAAFSCFPNVIKRVERIFSADKV